MPDTLWGKPTPIHGEKRPVAARGEGEGDVSESASCQPLRREGVLDTRRLCRAVVAMLRLRDPECVPEGRANIPYYDTILYDSRY